MEVTGKSTDSAKTVVNPYAFFPFLRLEMISGTN